MVVGLQRQVMIGNHVFHHGARLLVPVDSVSANATAVRFQRAGWQRFPLSAFGETLCSNDARKKPVSLQTLWASHQATMQREGTATNPNGCFSHLCLELGQLARTVPPMDCHEEG